jgi:WD40 repeat protein
MYNAFISYSHAADGKLAPALQSSLHRFAKPWFRLRALRLFRDKTSLSATPSLWPLIQNALDQSAFFILLASPEAAASSWVDREIRHWLTMRSSKQILIVLTDGELRWDDANGAFNANACTALPAALASAFHEEPLWVDLRWARQSDHLSLSHAGFRDAVAELAAPLHGRPKDEIAGEDVRQHRRTRRVAWSAVIALFLLAVGMAGAAWMAIRQRDEAEQRGRIALSRQLAAQAISFAGSERGDLALLLSLEALRISQTVDAENSLLTALVSDSRCLFYLHGHMDEVISLSFSADGQELLSLGCEGIDTLGLPAHFGVRRWDMQKGESKGELMLIGASRWTSLMMDPTTKAVVAQDGQRKRWNPLTGEPLGQSPLHRLVTPTGEIVSETIEDSLVLTRGDTGQVLEIPQGHPEEKIKSVDLDPSGAFIATGGSEGSVRIWGTRDLLAGMLKPDRILDSHEKAVPNIAFSPQGRYLVTGSWDNSVRIWDLQSNGPARSLAEQVDVSSIIFSQDGRWLVIATRIGEDGGELRIWDAVRWQPLFTVGGKAPIAISPKSDLLASAGAAGSVIVRDLKRVRPLARVLNDPGEPLSLTFINQGATLVAGCRDQTFRMWKASTGAPERPPIKAAQGEIHALAADPGGKHLASGGEDGRILIWKSDGQDVKLAREINAHTAIVYALDFSPDGQHLVSGGFDKTVRFWNVETGQPLRPAVDIGVDVYSVKFDSSGTRVAVADESGSVLLCRLTEKGVVTSAVGTHLLSSDGMTGLAFGPKDRFLISSSPRHTQLWGLRQGESLVLPPLEGSFAVLAPAGDQAAVVSDSEELRLIDIASWRVFVAPLGRQQNLVNALAFSPDGHQLAAAAADDLVLWDVDLHSWQARACAIARRNLSADEWKRYLGERPYRRSCPEALEPSQIPLDAERALGLAVRAAKLGQITESRRLFAKAAGLAATGNDARLANDVCWFGALNGAPSEVISAGERAVLLEPNNVAYRDSRGIARALRGDMAAAIDDFRAYGGMGNNRRGARRKTWIQALEAGNNPFDSMELHSLQNETWDFR